jgi:hypothetical protein
MRYNCGSFVQQRIFYTLTLAGCLKWNRTFNEKITSELLCIQSSYFSQILRKLSVVMRWPFESVEYNAIHPRRGAMAHQVDCVYVSCSLKAKEVKDRGKNGNLGSPSHTFAVTLENRSRKPHSVVC